MSNTAGNINPEQLTKLITEAANGNQESLNTLAAAVRPRVYAFILRTSLDKNITEDLVQETLMQMTRSIGKLQKPESFWPWLFKIASNKFNEYLRIKKDDKLNQSIQSLIDDAPHKGSGVSANLNYKEMTTEIFRAMAGLKTTQRQIVSMRCFDNLSFAEIGQALDCTEENARVNFFRTRQFLQKHLKRKGYTAVALITGMLIFGNATSSADASIIYAATVPAMLKETIKLSFKSYLSVHAVKIITALLVCLITAGSIVAHYKSAATDIFKLPQRADVKSFHYVTQAWDNTVKQVNTNLSRGRSLSKGAFEQWFFFPDGIEGPMFMMMQRWNPQQTAKLCGWLQNAEGNYYYDSKYKTIHIYNTPLPLNDLKTRRLPTDTEEFTTFLDNVEGLTDGIIYERDSKTGLLKGVLDNRFYNANNFHSSITFNGLEEKSFGNFRYHWDADSNIVDERDDMHQRGWTFFKITGSLNGSPVEAFGRVPFVYDKLTSYPPAFYMNINKTSIIDVPTQSRIVVDGKTSAVYPGGTFFKGFLKPWMGMHILDIIRRDAAEKKIPFKIRQFIDDNGIEFVELNLIQNEMRIQYTINMNANLIEKIEFYSGEKIIGTLYFDYTEQSEDFDKSLTEQIQDSSSRAASDKNPPGASWLFDLANGNLVK